MSSSDYCDYSSDSENENEILACAVYGDKSNDKNTFTVLSPEEVVKYKEDIIREVTKFFEDIPTVIIFALLNHVKGDFVTLVTKLYEDPDRLFKDARLVNPATMQHENQDSKNPTENGNSECPICCECVPVSRITGLKCGHQCCDDCWSEYFTENILGKGRGQGLTCLGYKCEVLVDDEIIMRLAAPNVKAKYQHLLNKTFVECSRYLTWCPAPGCNYAIKMDQSERCKVTCKCGRVFCFECSESWHGPIDCTLYKKWLKKISDDTATEHWITVNTKPCPKCKTPIERIDGCDHMMCMRKDCKYEFCWICLVQHYETGMWNAIICNKQVKDKPITDTDSRKELDRYLHYHNYYFSHQLSLKLEERELPSNIQNKRTRIMHNLMIRFHESEYLCDAVNVLRQCRETLMITYVFAYYLEKNDQSIIFEDNQSYLQKATEALSGYLQKEFTCENKAELNEMIQNKTRYCGRLRQELLEHVHEGYTKEWWRFTE